MRCSTQGIDRFLTKNTQIGIRRTQEGHEVYTPNGYDDVAAMIVRPNPGANFSAVNYQAKAARWKAALLRDSAVKRPAFSSRPLISLEVIKVPV